MLDLHLARLVGAAEDRVGRVSREAVARIRGDHLRDQAAPEEECAEGTETGHDQGEFGMLSPILTAQLASGGGPATVAEHDVDRVAGPDMPRDRIFERGERGSGRHGTGPGHGRDTAPGGAAVPHCCLTSDPPRNLTTVSG